MNNTEFLSALSGKLQNANRTVVLEKKRQRQEIQQRIDHIESMFMAKKKFQMDAIQKAKFSVDRISALSNETVKNFNLKSRKQQELARNLKQQMQNQLDNIEREHQEKTEQVIERQTQKMTQIIQQLTKKSKTNSQLNQKSLIELTKAISNLEKNLQDESEQRKDNCRQIQQDISNEVTKFNAMIQRQRERREISQHKIQGMMGEIRNKVTAQIQALTNKRKKNNAAILKLIEGACQRLQQKLQICL